MGERGGRGSRGERGETPGSRPHPPSPLCSNLTKPEFDAATAALTAELDWLEAHADSNGPYFCGVRFSLADAGIVPFFLRLFELKARAGFELPARCVKLIRWYGAVVERASVGATLVAPPGAGEEGDDYEAALARFFVGYLGPRPAVAGPVGGGAAV